MHECPFCGEVCDCDGEDTWFDFYPNCEHQCGDELEESSYQGEPLVGWSERHARMLIWFCEEDRFWYVSGERFPGEEHDSDNYKLAGGFTTYEAALAESEHWCYNVATELFERTEDEHGAG